MLSGMRTTLTLDDDVAIELERVREERKVSFKEVVNTALRSGLKQIQLPTGSKRARYSTPGVDLGPSLVGSLDNIGEVLALIEGEDYR